MKGNSRELRFVFVFGAVALFSGIAAGLYHSFEAEHQLPPVELSDIVDTYLDDIEGLIAAEEYDQAISQLELTLRLLFRNRHLPLDMLGRALAKQGRLDEAVQQFRQALELDPEFATAHYNLGVTYASMGNVDQAIAELREALRIAPDFTQAQDTLARLRTRLEPQAGPPATVDDETAAALLGRDLARRFYRGELEPLHERFSPSFASTMSLELLREMHATLRRQLGAETQVIGEKVGRVGDTLVYVRRARFDQHDGDVEILIELEQDGSIAGILFRPAVPDVDRPGSS